MSNEPGQPPERSAAITRELATPSVALAVGAHPDDVEFGCGATLAKWASSGCVVHHVVCTDGSKGTWDADADPSALAARRDAEQRRAAARLSGDRAGEVVMLGAVDGELDNTRAMQSRLAFEIRRLRPDVILGHDPWRRYRIHPDHRNAGLLTCDSIVAARDPHFFREHGLEPHRPAVLLLWEADEVHHVEDVTGFVETKLYALEAHESQFESTMKAVDAGQLDQFRQRIRRRLAGLGITYGCDAAECFAAIRDL